MTTEIVLVVAAVTTVAIQIDLIRVGFFDAEKLLPRLATDKISEVLRTKTDS